MLPLARPGREEMREPGGDGKECGDAESNPIGNFISTPHRAAYFSEA